MQAGNVMVETREVADFDYVILRGSVCCAEVYIEQREIESLTIEAEPNAMPRIETGVRDRKLIIRQRGSLLEKLGDLMANDLTRPKMVFRLNVRELKGLDVYGASYLHIPSLNTESLHILWTGAGSLAIDSFIGRKLEIEQSGAGSLEIAGRVDLQKVKLSGVSRYDGSKLLTERIEIRVAGSGLASVYATDSLKAVVHGVGIVEYAGGPQVSKRVTGAGSVVRAG